MSAFLQDLQRERGGRKCQAEASNQRGGEGITEQPPYGVEGHTGQKHLGRSEAEDVTLHPPEFSRVQLQTDDKQQQDDAKFGDMKHVLARAEKL